MAKFDWQKAKERDAARDASVRANLRKGDSEKRQAALAAFVENHELSCFKCGAGKARWAKTGVSKRGPWAICAYCVAEGGEALAGGPPGPLSP